MIGSQNAECKDVHTVGFPDSSRVEGQVKTRTLHNSPFVPQDKKSAVPTKAKRSEWKC
jgi:hypothetical protein